MTTPRAPWDPKVPAPWSHDKPCHWTPAHFDVALDGYDVPAPIAAATRQIVSAYGIRGMSDPAYIANVIAHHLGLGDGKGTFHAPAPEVAFDAWGETLLRRPAEFALGFIEGLGDVTRSYDDPEGEQALAYDVGRTARRRSEGLQ